MEDRTTLASDLSAIGVTRRQGRVEIALPLFSALPVVRKAINAKRRRSLIIAMRDSLLNGFATDAAAILTPGVIVGRLVRFPGFVEMGVDIFGQDNLGLAYLLAKDRVRQGIAFVEDGDLSLGVLADRDLSLA